MIRFRGTVTFADGTETTWECGTRGQLAWENYARRHEIVNDPQNPGGNIWTMYFVMAHYALTGTEEGFAAWTDTVAGVEPDTEAAAELVPPTLKVAPAE